MVAYDLEGVLVDEESIWVKLSRAFGTDGLDPALKDDYLAGKISYKEWSDHVVSRWKGKEVSVIDEFVRRSQLMPGAKETTSILREAGIKQVIITNSISHLAYDVGERLGISRSCIRSNILGVKNGKLTGRMEFYHSWEDKSSSLNHFATILGVGMGEIAVVGDGINDIEIIKDAGLGIAFCPEDPGVRESADYVVEHKDLSEIIGLVDIY